MITTFINEDGGAGKTTIPASLAPILANRGDKVLLIDLTPKCSLTRLFTDNQTFTPEETLYQTILHNAEVQVHKTNVEGVELLAGHEKLNEATEPLLQLLTREKLQALNEHYDHILIDTANNGNLVDIAITSTDRAIIVLKPSRDSLHGAIKSYDLVQLLNNKHNLNIQVVDIILNQYDDSSTCYKIEAEMRGIPAFTNIYRPEHIIYDSKSINRLQYMYQNVGMGMEWIRAAKSFKKIAEDMFE